MSDDARGLSFSEILRQAVADLSARGYSSEVQIQTWLTLLRTAAERDLPPEQRIDDEIKRQLGALYAKLVDHGKVIDHVPGIGRYSLGMIRPELRAELDRRILASASLINIHRREAIEKTLQRFQGWSTSIPPGGEGVIDKREVKTHIAKSLQQFRFEKRRVQIDQGAKLLSNIADIVAVGNGAIAAQWHSRFREPGYDARPDHIHRDGLVYAVRSSWALDAGLMNKGAGYMDEMTAPAEEPFCRCTYRYILSPRQLPETMLTRKGREWIAARKEQRAA